MKFHFNYSPNFSFRSAATGQWLCGMLRDLFTLCVLGAVSATSVCAVELISINKDGTDSGNRSSYSPVVSPDGRFVAFISSSDDLVPSDDSGPLDVFLRDRRLGTTTLVSVNRNGTDSANGYSRKQVISADGRFVAFESNADDLVAMDGNGDFDVFVRDLQSGITSLVSINRDGTDSATGYSTAPKISADGRFVVFQSDADDLVDGDSNGDWDVFVRDLQRATTTLVSINRDGTGSGTGYSGSPMISADGRSVVFVSSAGDLVDNDLNGSADVFVRDLESGTTTLVSVNRYGAYSGAGYSAFPAISSDGRFVAFFSNAGNLVDEATSGIGNVFVRDLQRETTSLVSINRDGTGTGYSRSPAISADGRFVTFASDADNLVDTDSNGMWDVFVRDLQNGTTSLVSTNRDGTTSGTASSDNPIISANGRFVVFESAADNLVTTDTNGTIDVFVRDLQRATTTLVSVNKDMTNAGASASNEPAISADGRIVAFQSGANDLVNTDTNGTWDIFASEVALTSLESLSFNPPRVNAGERANGILTLSAPAPSNGFPVSLRSSNPGIATVAGSLTIPAGADSGRFVVNTSSETCSTWVEISATGAKTTVSETLYIASDYTVRPPKPTGFKKFVLKVPKFKREYLALSWDSIPGIEKFVIDRKIANRPWANIGEVDGMRTAFMPPPQTPCVGYQYRLRAQNPCGSSAAAYVGHLYDDGSCPF